MALLDLVFPSGCAGCGRPGAVACAHCIASLSGPAALAWPRPSPAGLPPPWAVTAYDGSCRGLLIAYKERDAVGVRGALAAALAQAIRAAVAADGPRSPRPRTVIVAPMPSTARAVRSRGDDVMLVLARRAAAIARSGGLELSVVRALRHDRSVADSAGLTAAGRAANLAGAFGVRRSAAGVLRGADVLVVDDLITTGTSIAEAARALRQVGARVVGAATIAATARHSDGGLGH